MLPGRQLIRRMNAESKVEKLIYSKTYKERNITQYCSTYGNPFVDLLVWKGNSSVKSTIVRDTCPSDYRIGANPDPYHNQILFSDLIKWFSRPTLFKNKAHRNLVHTCTYINLYLRLNLLYYPLLLSWIRDFVYWKWWKNHILIVLYRSVFTVPRKDNAGCKDVWLLANFTHVERCSIQHNSEATLQLTKHIILRKVACAISPDVYRTDHKCLHALSTSNIFL